MLAYTPFTDYIEMPSLSAVVNVVVSTLKRRTLRSFNSHRGHIINIFKYRESILTSSQVAKIIFSEEHLYLIFF